MKVTTPASTLRPPFIYITGPPGSGKTTVLLNLPNALILNCEVNGMYAHRDKAASVIEIESFKDLKAAIDYGLSASNKHPFLCIDGFTTLMENYVLSLQSKYNDARQIYGDLMNMVLPIMHQLRESTKKCCIITFHQARIIDEDLGLHSFEISIPGKALPQSLPYLADIILHIREGKAKGKRYRYFQTLQDRQYQAKDRTTVLNEKEPLDLMVIFNKLKKERTNGTTSQQS